MGWECTEWKKRAKIEILFLFFEPFSVQQNVSNLKAATLAAYRHANESWSDEFCINSRKLLQANSKQEKHVDEKKFYVVYIVQLCFTFQITLALTMLLFFKIVAFLGLKREIPTT